MSRGARPQPMMGRQQQGGGGHVSCCGGLMMVGAPPERVQRVGTLGQQWWEAVGRGAMSRFLGWVPGGA